MGEAIAELFTGKPWNEERTGMLVLKDGQPWDVGGPMVAHSPWWIREHWGRAFEVVSLEPRGFGEPTSTSPGATQGTVLLRRRDGSYTPDELERIEPAAALREALALERNLTLTRAELRGLRAELASIWGRYDGLRTSKSWRLTRPIRELARSGRALTRRTRRAR